MCAHCMRVTAFFMPVLGWRMRGVGHSRTVWLCCGTVARAMHHSGMPQLGLCVRKRTCKHRGKQHTKAGKHAKTKPEGSRGCVHLSLPPLFLCCGV